MKRLLSILLVLLLLTGCSPKFGKETVPETSVPAAEENSWIETQGKSWDAEGTLVELPLYIPNGPIYTSHMEFDGDLLFWSQDNHRMDQPSLELCILDLDTGLITAQKEIPTHCTMLPQPLGHMLYIADSESGAVLQLDKNLHVQQQWQLDFQDSSLYMGANGTAYVYKWDENAYAVNLETGEKSPILDANTQISYLDVTDEYLKVSYFHPDSGEECIAFLDLKTGERCDAPVQGISNCDFRDGAFLMCDYEESYQYTLIPAKGEAVTVDLGYDHLELLEDGLLLKISESYNILSIHDLTGKSLYQCAVTEQEYGYEIIELIPSETMGGYFVILNNYGGGMRLLYWHTAKAPGGENILFTSVPEPSEQESQIQHRVSCLETEYGVNILVGEEAGGYFYDFEAEIVTDSEDILDALNVLEDALEEYPEGFFRQLRYGEIQRTEIHLMGAITATNAEYVDTYEAFVQDGYQCHVMVMDIYLSDVTTYYHEFSHVIDSFLEWDSQNREDALFSDDAWCGLNPRWFPGYTYDYSWTEYVEDYSCFVDDYSTINPTEDRARVLEYAMADFGSWTFEDSEVLTNKLRYYCRCIRDAFDTTGWPEELPWEQYLR